MASSQKILTDFEKTFIQLLNLVLLTPKIQFIDLEPKNYQKHKFNKQLESTVNRSVAKVGYSLLLARIETLLYPNVYYLVEYALIIVYALRNMNIANLISSLSAFLQRTLYSFYNSQEISVCRWKCYSKLAICSKRGNKEWTHTPPKQNTVTQAAFFQVLTFVSVTSQVAVAKGSRNEYFVFV